MKKIIVLLLLTGSFACKKKSETPTPEPEPTTTGTPAVVTRTVDIWISGSVASNSLCVSWDYDFQQHPNGTPWTTTPAPTIYGTTPIKITNTITTTPDSMYLLIYPTNSLVVTTYTVLLNNTTIKTETVNGYLGRFVAY